MWEPRIKFSRFNAQKKCFQSITKKKPSKNLKILYVYELLL